jgi:hypothetical protein
MTAEIERLRATNAAMTRAIARMNAQITGLEEDVERAEDALHRIVDWADAYPLAIFTEPDMAKAHAVLTAAGMTLDAISASAMRHVVDGVGKIARAALSYTQPPPR